MIEQWPPKMSLLVPKIYKYVIRKKPLYKDDYAKDLKREELSGQTHHSTHSSNRN